MRLRSVWTTQSSGTAYATNESIAQKKKKRHEHKQVILYMYTAMIRPSSVMAVQENETKQAGYTIMTLYQTLLIFTCP